MNPPVIEEYDGMSVVRDDLIPGGTKARYIPALLNGVDEAVYASPAEGGAQTALAYCAARLGKRATIFVAKRKIQHPRTVECKRLGAKIILVRPGYLTVVQARAREYSRRTGARLIPFGVDSPEAVDSIAEAARSIGAIPAEVWCASGSGVLARGLSKAWPNARMNVVEVGRKLSLSDVAGARIHSAGMAFSKPERVLPPFPSDLHYDAKAWRICKAKHGSGPVLFWNVMGQPEEA